MKNFDQLDQKDIDKLILKVKSGELIKQIKSNKREIYEAINKLGGSKNV